jgi:hypothetical protein
LLIELKCTTTIRRVVQRHRDARGEEARPRAELAALRRETNSLRARSPQTRKVVALADGLVTAQEDANIRRREARSKATAHFTQ